MLTKAPFFAPAGSLRSVVFAVLALITVIGCRQRSDVGEVAQGNDRRVETPTNNIIRRNDTAERSPIATTALVDGDPKKTALSIWRSRDSTVEERADAVNRLLSPEATIQSAKNLLGKDGVLSHHFGPHLFGSAKDTNVTGVDYWLLNYTNARGFVAVRFSRAAATNQLRFERAYGGRVNN